MDSRSTTLKKSRWQKLKQHFSEAFSEEFVYDRGGYDAAQLSLRVKQRGRDAYRYILLLLAFVLLPMDIHYLYTGRSLPAVAGLLLLSLVLVNIWLLSRGRRAFLSPSLLLFFSMCLIFLSVLLGQQYVLFWLYPLLVALPVMLRKRRAIALGVLSGLLLMPLVYATFDRSTATVLSFSLALTWLVSAWLVFAVTEQSRHLKAMAITDPLTGAYNRRYLQEQAKLALGFWRRNQQPTSMLLIDIDYFKRINDRFGHAMGDKAIKRLVELISGRLRSVDTVCRFGGEEFVILVSEAGGGAATVIAEELRALIEASKILPEGNMTISIGVCEVAAANNLDHWLNLTDSALYLAKRNGRNRVEVTRGVAVTQQPIGKTVPDWR